MDEYSLLTSEIERNCGKDLESSICSTSQTWEEFSLTSEDEESSLVSSDNEELNPSELMDENDPAKHNDGPSCSFVADEPLSDYQARRSDNDLRAKPNRTDHPKIAVSAPALEALASSSPSDKEIKQSRKKDKGMYREMLVLVSFERI